MPRFASGMPMNDAPDGESTCCALKLPSYEGSVEVTLASPALVLWLIPSACTATLPSPASQLVLLTACNGARLYRVENQLKK